MATIGRDGHRARLRQQYYETGFEDMSTRTLLELYLSLSIPRKDVKSLLYAVLNKYPTVTELFSATYDELMSIENMRSTTAMSILTLNEIINRAEKDENKLEKPIKRLIYARSIFDKTYNNEALAAVFMTGSLSAKSTLIMTDFSFNDRQTVSQITNKAVQSKASTVYIAHYIPCDNVVIGNDVDFLCDIKYALRELNIEIIDYIILTDTKDIIMSQNEKLRQLFG